MDALIKIETDRVVFSWGRARGREPVPLAGGSKIPGLLIIRQRRTNMIIEHVWRSTLPENAASNPWLTVGPRIYEQTDYRLYARAKAGTHIAIAHRDPLITRDLSSEDGGRTVHGYINFGSQVGLSEFAIIVDGVPEFDIEIEVFPTKLDYATDYDQMLAEVQEILTGLALEYLRSTYQMGLSLRVPQPTHVEWLALLHHVASDLEQALNYIAHRPARSLTRKPVSVRAERIKRIDSAVRAAVQRGRGAGEVVLLSEGLRIHQRLEERRARPTLDTPEHRWIAAQLIRIRQRIGWLRRQEKEQVNNQRRSQIMSELDQLDARISRMCRLEPMVKAEGDPPAGFASLQLIGAPGYREAYRCCLVLSMGLRIEGGPVRLSVKDLSLLYEYWCYLALLRLVAEETGQPIPAKEFFKIRQQGLRVLLQKGSSKAIQFDTTGGRKITVAYNPQFKGEAILIPQQPDMLITFDDPQWPKLHLLLDAKYRIEASPEYQRRYLTPGPPEDALNVLHRYRDAILEHEGPKQPDEQPKRSIVQAAAAFPYRDVTAGAFQESLLWQSLERIGVGAVPLLPGNTEHLREWLRSALRRGGWTLSEKVIGHSAVERLHQWRRAAAEPVLVGVLKGRYEAAHMEWIRASKQYYMPLLKTQRRQFVSSWLALYSPTVLRKPGAVTHRAMVKGVDVVKRSEIKTPWPAGHRGDEYVVLYHLGGVEELARPIENKHQNGRGQRFSSHRWTSLLALERASVLEELLLETEPEWKLYEDLSACGLDFYLESGPVKLADPENPAGRVWFVIDNGLRIRYAGASGFIVKQPDHADRYFIHNMEMMELFI